MSEMERHRKVAAFYEHHCALWKEGRPFNEAAPYGETIPVTLLPGRYGNLLKPRVVIRSYNDHCSAPFSRALVGLHHQSLIGRGSRHCYGINYTH